jgi:hypothetical protein
MAMIDLPELKIRPGPSIRISPKLAHEMHWGAFAIGDCWFWTVTHGVSDYRGRYCARPASIQTGETLRWVLLARSLDDLRSYLPLGLSWTDRSPGDDPVILEVWI